MLASRHLFRTALVLAPMLVSTVALADRQEADALFEAGRAAADRGDCRAALPSFKRSQELDPAPGTLLNIAVCEEELGFVASAWLHLREAIAALPPNDDRLPRAKERAAKLRARVPHLRVSLAADAPEFTKVTCDGTDWAGPMLTVEQPVEPGAHECVVAAPGRMKRSFSITLKEQDHATLSVQPGPPVQASAPAPSLAPAPKPSRQPWLGYAVTGLGMAALGTGAVTGALVFSRKSTISEHCPDKSCDQQGQDAVQSARTLSTVSNVCFVAGAVGVAAGVYLLLTGKPQPSPVAPVALPGGGALTYQGRF